MTEKYIKILIIFKKSKITQHHFSVFIMSFSVALKSTLIHPHCTCLCLSHSKYLTYIFPPHDPHQPLENLVCVFSTNSNRRVAHLDTCANDHQRHLHVPLHGDLLLFYSSHSVGLPVHHFPATDSADHGRVLLHVPVLLPHFGRVCLPFQRSHRAVHRVDCPSSAVYCNRWHSGRYVLVTHPNEDAV